MKAKRKSIKATAAVGLRNGPTCAPASRSAKLNRKSINEVLKPHYQVPKFSSVHNPLIDDLLGELGTSMASEETPSLTLDNSDNNAELGSSSAEYMKTSLLSCSSLPNPRPPLNNLSKLAVDAVIKASKCFMHTLTKHGLKSYLSSPTEAAKETELRQFLNANESHNIGNLMFALIEIMEEICSVREQLKVLASFSRNSPNTNEDDMSNSMASVMSTASLMCPPVYETKQVAVAFDKKGHRTINRYVLLANIGEGSYGKVKLAEEMDSGKKVAIKMIDKQFLQNKFGTWNTANGGGGGGGDNALMREITIMKKVRHRNCVSLYEVIDDPASQKLYLIMDYVPNGPVVHLRHHRLLPAMLFATESNSRVNGIHYNRGLIRCCIRHDSGGDTPLSEGEIHSEPSMYSCRPLRETTCARYLRQLVSGLRYMHDRHVVHHDVKPDNVLLGADGRVYLTDFGVSEILAPHPGGGLLEPPSSRHGGGRASSSTTTASSGAAPARLGGGTLLFTAPELLDPTLDLAGVDPYRTDNWALGITLYCMLVGVVPFSGNSYRDVCANIRCCAFPWNGFNLEGESLLPEWRIILEGLLEKNPSRRWGLSQLKRFLDSADFQSKLATRAEAEGQARAERRRTSVINVPPFTNFASERTGNPSGEATSSPKSENTLKSSGFCRSTGIRQECMQKVAHSEGIEVMTRPAKQVSDKTKRIVRKFVESIRSRMVNKNQYFRASDFFPRSEGGITDSLISGKASEDLLKMHNLSMTDNRGIMALSSGSSIERASRNGNIQNWEKVADSLKRTHSVSPWVSQTQQNFVPVTKKTSRALYNGAFQSIDAILSIVNVQSESMRSNSFSFVSLCDGGSQKSSMYNKITPTITPTTTPNTDLDITMKCLPEMNTNSKGASYPNSMALLSMRPSLDRGEKGGGTVVVETPLQSYSDDNKISRDISLDSGQDITKRGRSEFVDTVELTGSRAGSGSSLFGSRIEVNPPIESSEAFMKEISRTPKIKSASQRAPNGYGERGCSESGQMRISDTAVCRKLSRTFKDVKRGVFEERKHDGKNKNIQQQLASSRKDVPNILTRRHRSKSTLWEVMKNTGEGSLGVSPLPDEA
ncbi:unnamed protein product [Phytomonas sp. Hart1]|nr:unnamed protein product [Phytomonas sp. Hart1]|eukprot:CCW69435.1 unnamed protein product [Phytomonas sp. isolate Hart1]